MFDADGVAVAFDPSIFIVDGENVIAAPPFALPAPGRIFAGIEVDVVCGYGDDRDDVPAPLRQAVKHLVAHWYDNRGVVAAGGAFALVPAGVSAMIHAFRVMSL